MSMFKHIVPPSVYNSIGEKFGKWTIIGFLRRDKFIYSNKISYRYIVKAVCDCGNKLIVVGAELKNQTYCIKCKPGGENWEKRHTEHEKHCPRCKEWKPLYAFPEKKNHSSGRQSYCYQCFKDYRRVWMRKKFYGITDEDFNKAMNEQDCKCAMCGRYEELVIDHCHNTGRFRGLICKLCNGLLGRFKDDTGILYRAIDYLNKHKQ